MAATQSQAAPVEAGFVDGRRGRLMSVLFRPPGEVRCAALFVHGFAEELTKARHMAALAARRLAAAGCAVQFLDLHGCGDSEGDLEHANLETWLEDLAAGREALARRFAVPVHLWGLRLGGLLACRLAQGVGGGGQLILWQPPAQGRLLVAEFLRLRTASGMLQGAHTRESVDGLRARLLAGEPLEVAGFTVARPLIEAVDALALADLAPPGWQGTWLEVARDPSRAPSPALARAAEAWRGAGAPVTITRVPGVPFWGSGELQFATALVDATVDAVATG